jgi:drug/metabolite transporter (DMT)-like permease
MTNLPATVIVLGRVIFAGLTLAGVLSLRRALVLPQRLADIGSLAISGVILALHWTMFFQSVQVSNVSIALLSFSSFPIFTTALEPLMMRERPRRVDILAALLILPGVVLIVPTPTLSNTTTQGVVWGLGAGLTFALLTVWNRRLTRRYSSVIISFYQDGVAAIFLLPTLAFIRPVHGITVRDLVILLALGVLCTALAHTLFIEGLRALSALAASVVAALEPVWGIVFALVLLTEVPTLRTVVGGTCIVGAALLPGLVRQPPEGAEVIVPDAALTSSPAGEDR